MWPSGSQDRYIFSTELTLGGLNLVISLFSWSGEATWAAEQPADFTTNNFPFVSDTPCSTKSTKFNTTWSTTSCVPETVIDYEPSDLSLKDIFSSLRVQTQISESAVHQRLQSAPLEPSPFVWNQERAFSATASNEPLLADSELAGSINSPGCELWSSSDFNQLLQLRKQLY